MTPQTFIEIYNDYSDPEEPLTARRFEWDEATDAPVDGSAEITQIESLDDLAAALSGGEVSEHSQYPLGELPTFGGDEPEDTDEIYSWDDERILIDDGAGDFVIEERE